MHGEVIGEICFNTSITGYQEILTDPSYQGQIINFTFPHIGNTGSNKADFESKKPYASGLILRNNITNASNYRSEADFNSWLEQHNIIGICEIDTRAVTQHIRKRGAQNVLICYARSREELDLDRLFQKLHSTPSYNGLELASAVSCSNSYVWSEGLHELACHQSPAATQKYKIVVIDYGIKYNTLRTLYHLGCEVVVVPAETSFKAIKEHHPDGIMLSNGPGDPGKTAIYSTPVIQEIIKNGIPLFGICMGHQLLALALGASTKKMAQGHRGANHPVQDLETGKVEITSQNHGYMVEKESLPSSVIITHQSLFDQSIEGIKLANQPVFSVQYHPESSPGPHDSHYLFDRFLGYVKQYKTKNSDQRTQ
jgi:carbamoyl-phosphate synthase small subunit